MKSNNFFTERGQALIIVALSAVVLFGFVALAIDGSAKFSDRRHAQNAADTAAMAGALALVNDETTTCGLLEEWECKAFLRAEDNGYDNFTDNNVWVFKCNEIVNNRAGAPLDCGPYEGNANYLSVIILSHVDTTFARVLGFSQTHNLVQAVTYWNKRGPMYDGNLIVSLNPDPCSGGSGNVFFSGNATITLDGGGAFVNSGGNGCGLAHGGSNCPVFLNDAGLGTTGNGNIDLDGCTIPAPVYDQDAYPFPPEMPDEPGACSGTAQVPPNQTTLNPGYYTSFPPARDASNKKMSNNITLNPGIYCLDTDLSLSNGKSITGTNVLIYLKSGNIISIQGGTISLSGREEGDYEGYVIIVDSNFSGQAPNCIINGNAGALLSGTIFAPYCDIQINGNDSTATYDTQIIGYTVSIDGTSNSNFQYVSDNNAQADPKIGLMR